MSVNIEGQQIGPLRIIRQLGAGGMGSVFLAQHTYIDGVQRAVKTLHPEFTTHSEIVNRFFNEARASGRLAHRNIVGVHHCGQLDDGTYYIVFDYIAGQTLAKLIETSGPLSPREIVRYVSQIANALSVAHALGIVHRDLKPENVLLTVRDRDDRHVVILDWGIASLSGDLQTGPRTKTGMLMGTATYMPPEQILGQRVGPPTDVYALGVIAYRLATGGWFPYQREATAWGAPDYETYYSQTPTELFERQRVNLLIDPRARGVALREEFVRALLAPLHGDPAQRPTPQGYALMLADESPPDGRRVVDAYAYELLGESAALRTTTQPARHGTSIGSAGASRPAQARPRYTFGKRIGAGGMAEVFDATMTSAEGIERRVAVKRVLPAYSEDEHFVAMFLTEARLAAQLQHPNIVSILECDRDAERQLFIAMDFIDGKDLHAVAKPGILPTSAIIFIVSEILHALKYAHNLLVHRDISPSNILVSWDGGVKLADFGLAKALDPERNAQASVFLKGKPRYMSPEQARNQDLNARSDLFAVGVVLWELLTHHALFDGETRDDVIHNVKHREIRPPSTHNANVKSDLDRVTLTLLERDVSKRYANADAAIAALLACRDADQHGRYVLARQLVERFPEDADARALLSAPMSNPVPTVTALPAGAPRWSGTSPTTHGTGSGHAVAAASSARWYWLAIAMIGLVAGAVAVLAVHGGDSDAASTPSDTTVAASVTPDSGGPARAAGTLTIETEPTQAAVRVDGVLRGKAPITIPVVPGRRVELDAAHDGFASISHAVTAMPGAQTVTLRLAELPQPPAVARPEPAPTDKPVRPARRKKPAEPANGAGSGSARPDPNGVSTDPDL